METKKITKEHLQDLMYFFERNETLKSIFIIYTYLNLIFILIMFTRMGVEIISLIVLITIFLVVIGCIIWFNWKYSLHLNSKKNKDIKPRLKNYLITGEEENDERLKKILDKLNLTERQYKLSQLIYVSYVIFVFSLEFFFLTLSIKILFIINSPTSPDIIGLRIWHLVEFSLNIAMLICQALRSLSFKSIHQLREFLDTLINDELSEIEKKLEKVMDLKLEGFKIDTKQTLKIIEKWNDVYSGSYFVGLREKLLISDYKNLVFSLENEIYYNRLFNDLKFKVHQSILLKKKLEGSEDILCQFIETNIKMLNEIIKSKLMVKNERRNKLRTSQTWIGILSITISIIFSLSDLPSLIGL